MDEDVVREQVARVERLLGDLETIPEQEVRAVALATLQALAGLYGEALARVMRHVAAADAGPVRDACLHDELIAHLLVLHDVHPDGDAYLDAGAQADAGARRTGSARAGGTVAFIPVTAVSRA